MAVGSNEACFFSPLAWASMSGENLSELGSNMPNFLLDRLTAFEETIDVFHSDLLSADAKRID